MTNTAVNVLNVLVNQTAVSAVDLIKNFPIAVKSSEAAYLARAHSFADLPLDHLLRAAAESPGEHRDFVTQAAIGSWHFAAVNPFKVLWPLYTQLTQ